MIYLPESDYVALRLLAKSEDRSLAELIREFVKRGLTKSKVSSGSSFLKKLVSYRVRGGKKLASKIDLIYK